MSYRLPSSVGLVARAAASPVTALNFITGFDNHMERQQPGRKARPAAERNERERQRLISRAALIERYGSEEAALAPCSREALLSKALAPWCTMCSSPWQRWTRRIEGYDLLAAQLPEHSAEAVAAAYPLPTTFAAAMAGHRDWELKRAELADLLGPELGVREHTLDLVAQLRADTVRKLAEHDLRTTTLVELHARFKLLRESEIDEPKIEAALFRDLETMVQAGRADG